MKILWRKTCVFAQIFSLCASFFAFSVLFLAQISPNHTYFSPNTLLYNTLFHPIYFYKPSLNPPPTNRPKLFLSTFFSPKRFHASQKLLNFAE